MKTFKQLLKLVLIALFMIASSTSLRAQNRELTMQSLSDANTIFMQTVVKETQKVSNEIKGYTYDSRYFDKIDATITITQNQKGKIVSIHDSSNYFSSDFLKEVIVNSNNLNLVAADSCGCGWWQILCQAYCALCEDGGIC